MLDSPRFPLAFGELADGEEDLEDVQAQNGGQEQAVWTCSSCSGITPTTSFPVDSPLTHSAD